MKRDPLSQADTMALQESINTHGLRATARATGVSTNTIKSALAGSAVTARVHAALRRVPPRVRRASDFERVPRIERPRARDASTSWTIEGIRSAIDAQMRGQFAMPKRLAEAMRRDDAIFTARSNRITPISAVSTILKPHDSDRGRGIATKAALSVQVAKTVLASIEGTLTDHGIAIGYVEQVPNDTGTMIDFRLTEWPLEHVRWNQTTETLETATRDGSIVTITHGDGRWIVFRRFATTPWREDACLLPASLVWASHAEGVSDWASSSRAHGLAKIVGELPEGSAINDDESGELTTAAQQFVEMLRALAEGDSAVGLRPFGAKTEFLANGSTAWQVFEANIVSREKAAARIYLGTDAMLGSVGGAPGVDISALFGVATTKLQSDFDCIETGLLSGLFEPWCAVNFGDTRYTPSFTFVLPDPDTDRKREERAANRQRLADTIQSMRDQKLEVTQSVINTLAGEYGVEPAPVLAAIDQQVSTITLAPTDIAKVVRVREARSAQGLPPLGDERDDMTIAQLDALSAAPAQ